MSSHRHLSRVVAVQALFAYEFHGGDPAAVMEHAMQEFGSKISDRSFACGLLEGVIKHQEEIRSIIEEKAPEWPVDKIAPVDRAILEIGIYEILYSGDVPPVVAINEGIEIAKLLGSENSPKFVNGVLSNVMHSKNPESNA